MGTKMTDHIKQETFEAVRDVSYENSFGMVRSAKVVTMCGDVRLTKPDYGYFEIWDKKSGGEEWYAEGGLWFEDGKLVDYDGVFALDEGITRILTSWGFDCSDMTD